MTAFVGGAAGAVRLAAAEGAFSGGWFCLVFST